MPGLLALGVQIERDDQFLTLISSVAVYPGLA